MFGLDTVVLAIIGLAALSAGALGYGVLYSRIEGDRRAESRVKRVKSAETDRTKANAARDRLNEVNKRRKSVQDSLKTLEEKHKENDRRNSPALKDRIAQAGLKISVRQFYIYSLVLGLVVGFVAFVANGSLFVAAGVMIVFGAGLPRWLIGFLRTRRMKAFLAEFPNALDIMVRSIKSGLPLNDAIRMISAEGQEPVRTEFKRIVEAQQMGLNIPEACARLYSRIPLSEANFFAIVIAIQAQAGGNLSEALGNLSKVLRERKKMKGKISAMSMEAKASAAIIGALPFIVAFLVYLTSPEYIMILFTDSRGHLILGASAIWMSIGVMVMRNMINFDI
ncbi:MAG: type II secretion system F family protein [Hoeflea sp.]|uniref:type II secretion system F family protein n=1 Tax=Hoeflea sp. TaxID=1940281 RepID=UPI001DFE8263|nr:type II secretion system F family protein [Hoeflea sp.]MBU4531635.1 type II secretion system F family protein [Alphaproteobacteria bacterium]MBU4544492.1 type II secretion system F family protein [Alphaproteobacteria bacterium]MBU4552723.1 type II secretion system F family protein [Alphaproteobacteria bacterium]MBV1724911.1 type II secretion system F family protein [Hoeflea sp.]MBV1760931.1 type II secretion system F family protein [Hoeflea sp.]